MNEDSRCEAGRGEGAAVDRQPAGERELRDQGRLRETTACFSTGWFS